MNEQAVEMLQKAFPHGFCLVGMLEGADNTINIQRLTWKGAC